MKLNDIEKRKLINEAFLLLNKIESLLSSVDAKLARKERKYADNMALCRTGDTGNYEPNNVRWDTRGNNQVEAKALHYRLVRNGEFVEVYNLNEFVKGTDLSASELSAVLREYVTPKGHCKLSHKGYTKYKP